VLNTLKNIYHKRRIRRIKFKCIGTNVILDRDFVISRSENLSIGNNVYIGPGAYLSCIGNVIISDGTIIGPKITIYTSNHRYENANAIPYDNHVLLGSVEIGPNTWIGGNVVIVPGVKIGEGCIVAAGSVVTKDIDPFSIIGGNPAKLIKYRDIEKYNILKEGNFIYMKLKREGNYKTIYEL